VQASTRQGRLQQPIPEAHLARVGVHVHLQHLGCGCCDLQLQVAHDHIVDRGHPHQLARHREQRHPLAHCRPFGTVRRPAALVAQRGARLVLELGDRRRIGGDQ
jgi:hypothetical protein